MIKKEKYWCNLPHIQPVGGLFFVTYHVHGSLPKQLLEKWSANYELQKIQINKLGKTDREAQLAVLREEYFRKYDAYLDKHEEKQYFKDNKLAKIVVDSLHFWDGKKIEMICYCIMSNHVHAIFRLLKKDEVGNPVYVR